MISVEEFACRVPSSNAVKEAVIYCSAPDRNIAEVWAAVGTVGATLVALGFGFVEYRRGRRDRSLQEDRNSAAVQNEQFQLVLQLMKSVEESFPSSTDRLANRLIAQIRIYEQLLLADPRTPKGIADAVPEILTRFVSLAIQYSSENNQLADRWGEEWKSAVHVPSQLLGIIHFRLETALSIWHRTRNSQESAIAEVQALVDELEDYDRALAKVNSDLERIYDA